MLHVHLSTINAETQMSLYHASLWLFLALLCFFAAEWDDFIGFALAIFLALERCFGAPETPDELLAAAVGIAAAAFVRALRKLSNRFEAAFTAE